jgi:hypothetical protein
LGTKNQQVTLLIVSSSSTTSSRINNKKEWTWKINRLHPETGGTLMGIISDCADLISFEWLVNNGPQSLIPSSAPPAGDVTTHHHSPPLLKISSEREIHQWMGTSGYAQSSDGGSRIRFGESKRLQSYNLTQIVWSNKLNNFP